jgi:hypothetical protein
MREHVRRQCDEQGEEEVDRAAPAAPLLTLQRTAGNRAVQRLVWDAYTSVAYVPQEYLDQTVPFDLKKGELKADDGKPSDKNPTLRDILDYNAKLIGAVRKGFNVPTLNKLTAESADKLEARGQAATAAQDAALLKKLGDAAKSRNRIVRANPDEPVTAQDVDTKSPFVMRPTEYFAQAPDLPPVGTDLKKKNVPKMGKLTYYHYTCALIALVKHDGGLEKAKKLAEEDGKDPSKITDTPSAVYALHDYYVGRKIQYDDSSTRFQIMGQWGFSMIFSGETNWLAVGQEVELPAGEYVFDIPGHTLLVNVKKPVGKEMGRNPNFKDFFTPLSDKDNYALGDEHTKPVRYIWKKG